MVASNQCLNALKYLKNEQSYAPWASASKAVSELKPIFVGRKQLANFEKFVTELVTPFYRCKTLDAIDGAGISERLARSIAVNLACEFGVAQCISETYTKFKDFIENGTKLSSHNRGLIFANGIRSAQHYEIEKFWTIFLTIVSIDERKEAIASFGNIQRSADIERILNKLIEVNVTLSKSDRSAIIDSIVRGSENGISLVIQFLHKNLDKVNGTIKSVPKIIEAITEKIVTSGVEAQVGKSF